MKTLERILEYLDNARVRYAHTTHPVAYTAREVAAAEHLSPHKLAKTVIIYSDQRYGMAVAPADCYIDLEQVRLALDLTHIRLATEAEVGALFPDSELGAMPPFGNLFNMRVVLDESLKLEEFIAFNAGTHRDVIHMSFGDFVTLVQPTVAAIGRAVAIAGR